MLTMEEAVHVWGIYWKSLYLLLNFAETWKYPKKKRLLHFLKRGDNALIIKVNSFENLFMGEKGRKFYVTLQPGKAKESHSKLTAVSDHFFI